jgi:2-dehydropantoate 2-reductase
MRGALSDVVAAEAVYLTTGLFDECVAIAARHGFPPRKAAVDCFMSMLTAPGSAFKALIFREIEGDQPIEADHIVGDLLKRANAASQTASLLRVAYAHFKTYECRRARERQSAKVA